MKALIKNRWITFAARIIIAFVFLFAAFDKFVYPRNFVGDIGAYKIVPSSLLNLTAILLPGVEVIIGLALLFGFMTRGAAAIMTGLMVIFIGAFAFSNLLGIELFDCGCFPVHQEPNLFYIFGRDIIFLALALVALLGRHKYTLDDAIGHTKNQ
ncbi:MAG TPA: DoxX family membrane protein [candidate division Zixibacteria bacterium]|nr:DoxX family membrane protein [candidate division Zixibacteria bacterium]